MKLESLKMIRYIEAIQTTDRVKKYLNSKRAKQHRLRLMMRRAYIYGYACGVFVTVASILFVGIRVMGKAKKVEHILKLTY